MDELTIVGPSTSPPGVLVRFAAAGAPPGSGLAWRVSPGPDPADVPTDPPDDRVEWLARPGLYLVELACVEWAGPNPPDALVTRRVSKAVQVSGGLPPP